MRQNLKISVKFLIFILIGLFLVFANNQRALSNKQTNPSISLSKLPRQELLKILPNSFQFCLPNQLQTGEVLSIHQAKDGQYYLLSLSYSTEFVNTIFRVSNSSCQALTPLKSIGVDSLLRYEIERETVLALSVKKYQNIARQLGGMEQLEKGIIESHLYGSGHDEIYYTIEDVLAFKKLGINIPPSSLIFIVSPEGIYGLGENNQYKLIRPFN